MQCQNVVSGVTRWPAASVSGLVHRLANAVTVCTVARLVCSLLIGKCQRLSWLNNDIPRDHARWCLASASKLFQAKLHHPFYALEPVFVADQCVVVSPVTTASAPRKFAG